MTWWEFLSGRAADRNGTWERNCERSFGGTSHRGRPRIAVLNLLDYRSHATCETSGAMVRYRTHTFVGRELGLGPLDAGRLPGLRVRRSVRKCGRRRSRRRAAGQSGQAPLFAEVGGEAPGRTGDARCPSEATVASRTSAHTDASFLAPSIRG